MRRFVFVALLCICCSEKAPAQMISYLWCDAYLDKYMIREHGIKEITLTLHDTYRKRSWQKFKREVRGSIILQFDEKGNHVLTLDRHYTDGDGSIDTVHFYYKDTELDSLIYNNDKQLIKRIHPENRYYNQMTLYLYDSLGRCVQVFTYDSVLAGFPSGRFTISQTAYDKQDRIIKSILKKGNNYGRDTTVYNAYEETLYQFDNRKLLYIERSYIYFSDRDGKETDRFHFKEYYDYVNGVPVRIHSDINDKELYYTQILINITDCQVSE